MMYSRTILDHFQNPRDAGELARADAVVELTNPVCGDVLKLAVTVKEERIHEAKFLCRGMRDGHCLWIVPHGTIARQGSNCA